MVRYIINRLWSILSLLMILAVEVFACLVLGVLHYVGANIDISNLIATVVIVFISSVIALIRFWRKEYKDERRNGVTHYTYFGEEIYVSKDNIDEVINSVDDLYE